MKLAVIVINFRTPAYTIDCLASLEPERADVPGLQVLLVDNASGDDSLPRLREAIERQGWGEWVALRPQPENLGFAGGNNIAIRELLAQDLSPQYVLLLNSDTLVHPGCLKRCLDRMARDATVGAMSCMLRNRDGSVQNVCRRFSSPLRETIRACGLPYAMPRLFHWANPEDPSWNRENTARDVDWIGGAFMLLRRDVLERLGGLDESFFFYGEDAEFCHRLWRHGWRVHFDPAGEITHFGGGSSDATRLPDRRKTILAWLARFHFQATCYGAIAALWLRLVYTISVGLNLLALWLTGRRGTPGWHRTATHFSVLLRPLKL